MSQPRLMLLAVRLICVLGIASFIYVEIGIASACAFVMLWGMFERNGYWLAQILDKVNDKPTK